jgi:hypothetical protein
MNVRAACIALLALGLTAASAASAVRAPADDPGPAALAGPAGEWEGAIETPPPLSVTVHLGQVDGAWQGTIDITAQGAFGLPLEGVLVAYTFRPVE